MTPLHKICISLIFIIALILRFNQLGEIPTGLHADEASQGLNAYSLLKTGKDMYGVSWPILFRANGSYQPPVYTYLSTLSILAFGNTAFSARFVSALVGSLLVLLSFFLVARFGIGSNRDRLTQALVSALVLAISPWSIHFSRLAVEANLALFIDVLALLLGLVSLKRKWLFIPFCLLLGLSTHTYYTERITAILFLGVFLYLFRSIFTARKKEVFLGLLAFVILLLPHVYIFSTGALTRRLSQVSYLSDATLIKGSVINKFQIISGQFMDHYLFYFSPKNLFVDPGQELGRADPELAMFYAWFLLPLVFGIRFLLKYKSEPLTKLLIVIILLGPLPAGLTGDLFYPLRVLFLLWGVSMVIALGAVEIFRLIKSKWLRWLLFLAIAFYSIFTFFVSYFGLSRYLQVNDLGYSYVKLMSVLPSYSQYTIYVDKSQRSWGVGVRMAYLNKADPVSVQSMLASQMQTGYYDGFVNSNEIFKFGNIIIEPINWGKICGESVLAVGDRYSISPDQIKDHGLIQVFSVDDINHNPVLFGFKATKPCSS